jgi:hypothetical protein
MASAELRQLWKLHLIDEGLLEVRKRAANLDPGRALLSEIKGIESELAETGGSARSLASELTDLELKQKGIADKVKKIEANLYGGKIVNPREVEGFQKEVSLLNAQRASFDERVLELWDLVPPAKEAADLIEKRLAVKKSELAEFQKKVLQDKAQLEVEFKRLSAERPEMAKLIAPPLLARYETVKKQHDGIGMALIKKDKTCGGCGTLQPERTLQAAREDRTVTCESCHRILYYTEGLI